MTWDDFGARQGYVDARGEHRGSEQQHPVGTGPAVFNELGRTLWTHTLVSIYNWCLCNTMSIYIYTYIHTDI